MTELERSVEALKASVKQCGIDKRASDVVDQFTSYLVLLKSTSPSSQSILKLCSILRRTLVPLYTDFPEPALQLSSAVLRTVIDDKLRNALNAQNSQLSTAWNEVAVALLSGVLDFIEKDCNDSFKEIIALAFYPTICTLFFYQDTALTLLPRTQTTAYSLLHDTLVKHPVNQRRLRDHAVLGGSLIGLAISQSKDYLVIEALLNIVGWLIPPTHKTKQGKVKRTEFIKDLFGSEKHFNCSEELVGILQCITSSHWEDTAMKVMDALARSDITFPQPFALDEVDVCGKSYPQPTAFDRLHLDRDCFLVNVIEQDDVCESLKIPYGHIRSVTIDISKSPPHNKAIVHVDLSDSPLMGEISLDILAGQSLYLKFEIQREDLSRLMEALRRRGVVKLSFLDENLPKQMDKRKSVGLARSIRLTGDSSPLPQGSQYEDKVKHVENVYETNFHDDAQSIIAHTEPETVSVQQLPSRTLAECKAEVPESRRHCSADCALKTVLSPHPLSTAPKNIAQVLAASPRQSPAINILPPAVHASVFGDSDEELSEMSHELTVAKPRARAHSAKNAKTKSTPSVNGKSDIIPSVPLTRRTAKRRLIVDSDEEIIRATLTAVQMTAAVSSFKPDMKAETMTTEFAKTCIHDRHSSTMQSSSTIEEHTNHPEKEVSPVLQKSPTSSSDGTINPGSAENVVKPLSADHQVSPYVAIPNLELSPKTTADGTKCTSPVKKNLEAGKGPALRVSHSKPAISFNVPEKLAGSRRKWEDTYSSQGGAGAGGDDHSPRKKARNSTTSDIEIKTISEVDTFPDAREASSTASVKTAKKYGKKGKASLPIPLVNVDFDELPGVSSEGKTTTRAKVRGASKSGPKKRPVSDRQTRASTLRSRNEKPLELESCKGISLKLESSEPATGIFATSRPVDQITATTVDSPHNDAINEPSASFKPESALRHRIDKRDVVHTNARTIAPKDLIKVKNANALVRQSESTRSELSLFQIAESKSPIGVCKTRSTPKMKRTPWEDPTFISQHVSSDEVKPLEVSSPNEDPLTPIQDVASEDICEALFGDYIEYSLSLKGSEDPIFPVSSNPPPSPLKPPVFIDLTQDPSPVKNCQDSAKDREVRMLANEDLHRNLAENSGQPASVPDALGGTRHQHRTCTFTNDAMEVLVPQNPTPLPKILCYSEEQRKQLTMSNHTFAAARTNGAAEFLAQPRDMKPLPSAVSTCSIVSPLATRSNSNNTFQVSSMAHLTPNVGWKNYQVGASDNGIQEVIICPHKKLIPDHGISVISDDELESPRPARKLSSNRVRFDDVGLPSSLSLSSVETSSHPVKQMSVQTPQGKCKKKTPRENSYRNTKSDEADDIQDIVNVLNDIQTVIVKGIANKFRTVNKDISAGREELLYDAAEDLQALADAHARQFNSFIALEEDYSKHRVTMTRHWEGLIKSSEHLQDDMKKALQKHDRDSSSKTFPKSLLPPHSRFSKA